MSTIEGVALEEVAAVEGASINIAVTIEPPSFNGSISGDYGRMIMEMTMLVGEEVIK